MNKRTNKVGELLSLKIEPGSHILSWTKSHPSVSFR